MIDLSTLEKLEFQKVLTYISNYSATEPGKNKINSIRPLVDVKTIFHQGVLVEEAKRILIEKSSPPIEYLPDLFEEIAKSKVHGTILNGKKILEILNLAVYSRLLNSFINNSAELAPNLKDLVKPSFLVLIMSSYISRTSGLASSI